jgi:hypothetical protein
MFEYELIFHVKDTASFEEFLSTPKRLFPYILQFGKTFHIIADNAPFMEELDSCCTALLHWFSYLYVFNVGCSPEVTPAFLFIQHTILGVVDDLSTKSVPLKMFLKQLGKVVSSSDV